MIIRAGFRITCYPAGVAEVSVMGDMSKGDAEDAIALLELAIRQIRRQIIFADTEGGTKPEESAKEKSK